jgi:peptide methionine sulfoxide reductase msrA/msrB
MGIIVFVVLFALVAIGCQVALPTDEGNVTVGNPMDQAMDENQPMMENALMNEGPMAPDFSLVDLEGNTITLSELNGERVYLKFWASWCPICLSGLEEIDTLSGQVNDFKVFTIVSPDFNGEQNEEDFKAWFETQGRENMVVLLDYEGIVTKEYGVRGYPTSTFIGSDGVLAQQFPGHLSIDQIMTVFEKIK